MIITPAARWTSRIWLAAGFLFLYLPIIALVVYSFTDSPVPNVWAGFSLRWFSAVFERADFLDAFYNSLKLAALAASLPLNRAHCSRPPASMRRNPSSRIASAIGETRRVVANAQNCFLSKPLCTRSRSNCSGIKNVAANALARTSLSTLSVR